MRVDQVCRSTEGIICLLNIQKYICKKVIIFNFISQQKLRTDSYSFVLYTRRCQVLWYQSCTNTVKTQFIMNDLVNGIIAQIHFCSQLFQFNVMTFTYESLNGINALWESPHTQLDQVSGCHPHFVHHLYIICTNCCIYKPYDNEYLQI